MVITDGLTGGSRKISGDALSAVLCCAVLCCHATVFRTLVFLGFWACLEPAGVQDRVNGVRRRRFGALDQIEYLWRSF